MRVCVHVHIGASLLSRRSVASREAAHGVMRRESTGRHGEPGGSDCGGCDRGGGRDKADGEGEEGGWEGGVKWVRLQCLSVDIVDFQVMLGERGWGRGGGDQAPEVTH